MLQTAIQTAYATDFVDYQSAKSHQPLFLCGNALHVLRDLPAESIDFCMTSPPYWGQRQYASVGIGEEAGYKDYVRDLAAVCGEVKRVLKKTGSFWLNIGDTYQEKRLLGIPWRVALELTDNQGWLLRNDVIWNKVKGGPDNAKDKLRNVHEYVFHFTKQKSYFYDVDGIRSNPKKSRVRNGAVISATGVSGVRYRRQIELSTALSEAEKKHAFAALEDILQEIVERQVGRLSDDHPWPTTDDPFGFGRRFRPRRELREKGFYFLKYHPMGSKPGDVWDILPEDTQKRETHFAPYPEDLCKIPLLATCPEDGIALDPFCGTGTTNLVAFQHSRKSVGIDVADEYLKIAQDRCEGLP